MIRVIFTKFDPITNERIQYPVWIVRKYKFGNQKNAVVSIYRFGQMISMFTSDAERFMQRPFTAKELRRIPTTPY